MSAPRRGTPEYRELIRSLVDAAPPLPDEARATVRRAFTPAAWTGTARRATVGTASR